MDPLSIITTLGGCFVEPIKEHCGYLLRYDKNINDRINKIQRLSDRKEELEWLIRENKTKNKETPPSVTTWVKNVGNFLAEDNEAQKKCLEIEGWGPRYYLSRKAEKKSLKIEELLREAAEFPTKACYSLPPIGIGSSSSEGIKHFQSRAIMTNEVLKALADGEVNMVAIYGMGGTGKTTMAKEIAKRAKDEKLFDEFAMAVVSQTPNKIYIQDQIADMLGLSFERKTEPGRAEELALKLKNRNSVLVILDDVWQALNLDDIGIPYEGELNCCKTLLTSRNEEVLHNKKNVSKTFIIGNLSEEEAWNLFREKAGDCVDTDHDLHSIAKDVAKECGRLPQAIVTVGGMLQNKSKSEWRNALKQLQKSTPENIPGLNTKVYSSIELSYTYINKKEAQSCFLLCCLFPEDCDIPVEYLVRYGVGRRLFNLIDNVAEARDRVHAMIKNLKASSLLLHSEKEECVKMHDVVRDVAISIAKKENFLVECNDKMEEWPKQDTYEHSAISLVSQELKKHPEELKYQKHELLQLACGKNRTKTQPFPSNMIKEKNKVKDFSMEGMSFPSLPQSILVLQNLRTLLLEYCKIKDVSAIGALGKLEILSFLGSKIKELPGQIGNLSHLKLLDLSDCSDLQKIQAGLLSRLHHLEELYMFGVNVNWEHMEGNKEGATASLAELLSLSYFTALKIHIPNIEVLPKYSTFKNPELKFQIFAGEKGIYQELSGTGCYLFENSLALERSDASDIAESWLLCQLIEKCNILYLKEIKGLKNILYKLDGKGFECLKILRVFASEDVEYVIDATSHQTPRAAFPFLDSLELSDLCNLKEIVNHSQLPERSFSNAQRQLACFGSLRSLKLSRCVRLKKVFSFSIARGLDQLQQLVIDSCDNMEAIFSKEREDEKALDKIMFLKLTSIELIFLPRLIGFCTTVYPVEHVQPSPNQEVRRISMDEVNKMTSIQQHTGSTSVSHKFFSSKTILWPPNLERLEFQKDSSLEEIFNLEGLKVDHAVLAQLKTLKVQELPTLVYMWKNVPRGIQGFLSLASIEVDKCDSLRYLLPPSVAKLLVELQSIKIKMCGVIQNIVQRDGEEEPADIVVFPKVTSFTLEDLPNLVSFCINAYSFRWPSMKEISLDKCPKLKTFGSEIQRAKTLKKISRALDSLGFLGQCLECVDRNYDPTVVSDRGTTKNSKRSFSVNKEGTLIKLKNPRASAIDNHTEIWSLFPSHMIESLRNLESIKLRRCDSLEVIFQLEELNAEESHVASVLDQLRELDLFDLPKLKHIWMKGPERITGFGNLRFLAVWACNSLTYLLSPSIAKLLVMLEDIKVNNCEKIEEILERAREEEEEKEISFNKVKSILLKDLPKLKCFCNEVNAFKWPSLKEITVIRCPALSTFVPSDLNTPELEGVYDQIEWDQRTMFPWKGDLNATIQHMFKGKEKQVNQETQHQDENMSSFVEGDEDLMEMEIFQATTEKNEENLLERIRQQIGHLSHQNSNIKNLKDQFQKLGEKREGVKFQIELAKRNLMVIEPNVERWVEEAEDITQDLHRFLEEDVKVNKMYNLKSRYSLSRKAKKKTLQIDQLLMNGQFARVSHPLLPGIEFSSIYFESRTKMMEEVLKALRDNNVNMIAIYGMGGIGKTTMAKEVAKRAKDGKLFDEVVMAVVSNTPDLRKIQGQIADMLDLQFNQISLLARGQLLKKRLMDRSSLVILDDVWNALDLGALGIPYGGQHNGCKILLTSRSEKVCTQMEAQKIFPIKVLSEEEAWNLFRGMAGNCIDTPDLHPIAKDFAKECGGLPVAIVTVGRALENKSKFEWSAALQQLKNAIPKNIPGLDSKVYSSIELSYSYLKSDEAKSCFLLCCLFPEDYDILIEDLVRYGLGQRLFAKSDTVAEVRYRVHAIVKNLKRSSLLLDSEKEECVKMHNVTRDVAIAIADKHGFLVRFNDKMEEWPEKDSCERSTAISLVSQELKRYPDGLECPKLELLQLSCGKFTSSTLPADVFKGMNRLKVLFLEGMSFPSLPPSIRVLQNLRTLHLEYSSFEDVSAIGELRKLEMLSFLGSKIKELPREIGNLSHLKLLDLSDCAALQKIPPGLLSSLNHLEELHMFGVNVNWEPMEGNKEGTNASLAELMYLSQHLMSLKIHIRNIEVLPKDFLFRNQMIKFQIFAGDIGGMDDDFVSREIGRYLFKNMLVLGRRDASNVVESRTLLQLIAKSEILFLHELDKEGFHSQFPERSSSDAQLACFGNLRSLVLSRCSSLKNVFSLSTARGLILLQELEIKGCANMEEIFPKEGEYEEALDEILLSELTSIKLSFLPRLIGFCQEVGRIEIDEVTSLAKHEMTDIQQHASSSFPKSTPISYKLFSFNTILWAPNLEELELDNANSLEVVFDLEGLKVDHNYQENAVFAQLKTLIVRNLYKLTYVWRNVPRGIQGFQNLTSIEVEDCDRLRYLFPPSVAKLLVELQSIDIRKCPAIENIVQRDGEEEAADIIVFPKVKVIHLYKCPKLKTFGSEIWSPRKLKKISTRESVSRPQESGLKSSLVRDSPGILTRCLECVPRRKNNGPIVVSESDRRTTNKSQENSSVNKEGTSIALKDPRFYDSVDNPSNMWSLFPLHMITSLKNLESIYLGWCTSVEVIFQLDVLNVEESHVALVLMELRELTLSHLDKLMHIWKKGPKRIMGFQNLRLLEVRECNNLTNLFSPSIANLLVMLQQIKVLDCEKIQEILARSREEEKEEVLFYKVNSIMLKDLPNLKCFCNEANAFEWPSLQKITIIRCPNLRTYVPANLMTPKLEGVYEDEEFKTGQWKGDLNGTIEHIYKGKVKPDPISIYNPMTEEVFAAMGTPMEGFFDGTNVVAEAMAFAAPAATQGVPAKTPIPSAEPRPIKESAQIEKVSEPASIPAETLTPQKGVTPPTTSQTEIASPVTPLVISTSNPFAALSQAVKDVSSLVVTPSSIPNSTTYGPDVDLSSNEGSEEVFEDSGDKPTIKKRVSDSDEKDSDEHEAEAMEILKEPKTAADIAMPTAPIPATPAAPVSATPTAPISTTPAASISTTLIAPISTSLGPILTVPSQFEMGSSSTVVPDPVSEAATFFTRFNQPEVNDLDPVDFWGARSPYVDFHGFRVPGECASHLEAVYRSRGDFMRGFLLGRSARELFLKLLGSVMNDIEHNFIDTVSAERILQWKAAVQELIRVGFAVEFMLDHLHEISQAFFMKKVQPTVDVIDTHIKALKKEVADLEGHREHLLSSVAGSSRFGDQTLISGLY